MYAPPHAAAQLREVVIDGEVFRRTADGRRLAELALHAPVILKRTEGIWAEVEIEGWVPSGSVAPSTREGHNGVIASRGGERLRSEPAGSVTGLLLEGFLVDRLEERGDWSRIRRSGWVREAALGASDAAGGEAGVLAGVSAAALGANPDDYAGATLQWTVRFLSLERAEPERIDFYEGEPFLLARAPDPGDGLVYIAVPPDLLAAAEKLRPLQTLDVLVKVRTGRSALLRVPILDLLELY
ncbi:hypothetical protein [Candidatus Palauibacter sp.]|uniref:hypothetical protein n=1 Tax=Candidatus Palauibacter sp. TaxID=3101350 RepID=UPI003B023F6E